MHRFNALKNLAAPKRNLLVVTYEGRVKLKKGKVYISSYVYGQTPTRMRFTSFRWNVKNTVFSCSIAKHQTARKQLVRGGLKWAYDVEKRIYVSASTKTNASIPSVIKFLKNGHPSRPAKCGNTN